MEKDISGECRYSNKQSKNLVRLINRKKEYIEDFQKAKKNGVILKKGNITKNTTGVNF